MTTVLPKGWTTAPLGDLGEVPRGSVTPEAGTSYVHYSVPSFADGTPTLEDGSGIKSAKKPLLPGDILISKINPRINRVWMVGEHPGRDIIGSSEWIVIRVANESRVLRRYLLWYLRSPRFRADITSQVSGVTGSHTRAKPQEVMRYLVPIPPLAEQRELVVRLELLFSHLDRATDLQERLQSSLPVLERAELSAALSGRLRGAAQGGVAATELAAAGVPTDHVRPHPVAGWCVAELGLIAQTNLGKMLSPAVRGDSHARPYLRGANVGWGRFELDEMKSMTLPADEIDRYSLQQGDLIVVEGAGSADAVGRCAVWPGSAEPVYYQKALHRVRTVSAVLPEWVELALTSFVRSGQHLPYLTGTTIKHLSQVQLRRVPIPVPPLEAQRTILDAVEHSRARRELAASALASSSRRTLAARRSILLSAMAGRLSQSGRSAPSVASLAEEVA